MRTPSQIRLETDLTTWDSPCARKDVVATNKHFLEVMILLLEQVQLNSTHLFRADILLDTLAILKTAKEKEEALGLQLKHGDEHKVSETQDLSTVQAPDFTGFVHYRTIIRRLIPRKPQLDKPLMQTCLFYSRTDDEHQKDTFSNDALVILVPHVTNAEGMPWYHPKVRALAYLSTEKGQDSLSIELKALPFPELTIAHEFRLVRTFESLLKTVERLIKLPRETSIVESPLSEDESQTFAALGDLSPKALKDTVLPQHRVQDCYTRLKEQYAADIIERWVEKTEPSKHVFEDLSIAAFLIELWKARYGSPASFAGFVDLACGNGLLVYVLNKEGWHGRGLDARKRKSWATFGPERCLEERFCVPVPFANTLSSGEMPECATHDCMFEPGTFIISNHADQLTCWTPLLSVLSCPQQPLPFLIIPCCSHALDGSKKRYSSARQSRSDTSPTTALDDMSQSNSGDLKILRREKLRNNNHTNKDSTYASLTRKTAQIAEELGVMTQLTLMRIPSTRNIGIVGNLKLQKERTPPDNDGATSRLAVKEIVDRECAGDVKAAARLWCKGAESLQGLGRGKVNRKQVIST